MSDGKKYNPQTIMALLKLMLSIRNDLTKEEKEAITRQVKKIIDNPKGDYEDKQIFPIQDYKRRN